MLQEKCVSDGLHTTYMYHCFRHACSTLFVNQISKEPFKIGVQVIQCVLHTNKYMSPLYCNVEQVKIAVYTVYVLVTHGKVRSKKKTIDKPNNQEN